MVSLSWQLFISPWEEHGCSALCSIALLKSNCLLHGLSGWVSRWEEERYTDGVKWKFLEHKGPVFAPPYEPLPSNVKFYYDGRTAVNAAHADTWWGCRAAVRWCVLTTDKMFNLNTSR